MTRLSFPSLTLTLSRAYDLYFHLFWIFLTCVAWSVIWPAFWGANSLHLRDDVTDLERLVYDTTRLWCMSELQVCTTLSIGCIIGLLPKSKFRTRCTRALVHLMLFFFVQDSFSCYLAYNILQSRGFGIIGNACKANKPADLSEIPFFEELCRDIEIASKYVALAALVMWKLVGLNMIVLTWIWYKCSAMEQTGLRERIEKEVREGAGPLSLQRGSAEFRAEGLMRRL